MTVLSNEIKTESQTWFDPDEPSNQVVVTSTFRVRHERGQPVHVQMIARKYTVRASTKEASDKMWALIEQTEAKLEAIRAHFRQGPFVFGDGDGWG